MSVNEIRIRSISELFLLLESYVNLQIGHNCNSKQSYGQELSLDSEMIQYYAIFHKHGRSFGIVKFNSSL